MQERTTKAIYIQSYKREISTRAFYGCKDVKKYTGYTGYGNRFPEELTACGHKIPRVMHVIHKFLQAISEIAPPMTADSSARRG